MSDTELPPVSRIQQHPSPANTAHHIDPNISSAMKNNNNELNPITGMSQAGRSTPTSAGLSRFTTAPLPQGNAPIPVPLHVRALHSSHGTPALLKQLGCVHRVTLEARDPIQNPGIYSRAPWFHPTEVLNAPLIESYSSNGMLPGGLPLDMVKSRDWRGRIAVAPNLLRIDSRRRENLARAREEMTRLAYKRVLRSPNQHLVPTEYDFDVSRCHTYGEVSYGDNLSHLNLDHFESAPTIKIEADMLFWARPIIPAKFQYLRRSETQATFSEKIRFGGKARSRNGHLIPYTNIETEGYLPQTFRGRFAALPPWLRQVEVPKGCFPELPPCLTYISSFIIDDPKSGYWSLVAAEWPVCIAVFLLWEAYDNYPIWFVPPMVRNIIKHLELFTPLGCQDNGEEVVYIIDVMDQVNRDVVPWENRVQGSRNPRDKSPGRQHPNTGDFVYYDPYVGATVSRAHAFERRSLPRTVPAGYPTGSFFHDVHAPPIVFDDPMLDDKADEGGHLAYEQGLEGVNAGASHQAVAPERWGFEANRREQQPLPGGSTPFRDPRVTALCEILQNLGIPVPPDVVDVRQLLTLAAANYPRSTSQSGAGPSQGVPVSHR